MIHVIIQLIMSGEFNFKYSSSAEDPLEDCLGGWFHDCNMPVAEELTERHKKSPSGLSDTEEDLRVLEFNVEREGDSLCVQCDRSDCHTCLHISRGS
jgi:hypothetical protein